VVGVVLVLLVIFVVGPVGLFVVGAAWSALHGWLLSDEVQLTDGDLRGAVLGWFDGRPESFFAYGESTGYFLSYLSYRHALLAGGRELEDHAAEAGTWLGSDWAPGATPPAAPTPAPAATGSTAFRYKIEASRAGKEYTTVLDKTNNDVSLYTEFDEIPPTTCRFIRLTITDWPHRGTPLGVMEFTVFGKGVGTAPKL